jgi:hypothetical protein
LVKGTIAWLVIILSPLIIQVKQVFKFKKIFKIKNASVKTPTDAQIKMP